MYSKKKLCIFNACFFWSNKKNYKLKELILQYWTNLCKINSTRKIFQIHNQSNRFQCVIYKYVLIIRVYLFRKHRYNRV